MKNVLLLNGSPHAEGCTCTALREVQSALTAEGVPSELLWLGTKPVAGCIACGKCAGNGRCVFDDLVNQVLDRLDDYGALVVGSPVYYAGPAAQVCAFLDRLFYCAGDRMYGKAAAAVVSCRRGGATAAFDRLNKYFTISNMVVAGSQYWNQVHGNSPDQVRQDLEGLQTMRTLGKNLAWLLRSLEAGAGQGVAAPAYEEKTWTNFIR